MRSLSALLLIMCCCTGSAEETPVGLSQSAPNSGRAVKTDDGYMIPYEMAIPGTDVVFHMEPIPAGEITVGTDRRRYKVAPFWMGRYEITWKEYRNFMDLYDAFKQFQIDRQRIVTETNEIDAITAPTPLYDPSYTFEYGDAPELPAITVTQLSAKQYTKWLSAITQQQYRLPSEAEWEHACRAGADTAYHFGVSADGLGEYAWFAGNSDDAGARHVGQGKPNSWDLYDMHGNVAELVLDGPDKPQAAPDGVILDATIDWIRPQQPDQRKVCGGSWELPAEECTATSRMLTVHEEWKDIDPNVPKSPWWFTDDPARGVGFRIMRPLKPVSREQMEEYWKIDNESIQWDVFDRVDEGRGAKGLVDKDLPAAIQAQEEQ